jgi:hypothetical protein
MEKTKLLLTRLANSPTVHKAAHTFWQSASAYLIYSVLVANQPLHTVGDYKVLLVGAIAAGLSALKTLAVARRV